MYEWVTSWKYYQVAHEIRHTVFWDFNSIQPEFVRKFTYDKETKQKVDEEGHSYETQHIKGNLLQPFFPQRLQVTIFNI